MNGAQKAIKGLAIALAIVIMVSVLSACVGAGMLVSAVFGGVDESHTEWSDMKEIGDGRDFDDLTIDVGTVNVRIGRGQKFQVLTNDDRVKFVRDGEEIRIEERDSGFWQLWEGSKRELRVSLLEEEFDSITLKTGVGTVYAEEFETKRLEISVGAGRAEFVGVIATQNTRIDGGVGALVVRDAKFENVNLSMGVGKVELGARLEGSSKIDAGLGKLELTLIGEEDDYRVEVDQGMGALSWDGIGQGNSDGKNLVEIDGGVGAIDVRLESGGR